MSCPRIPTLALHGVNDIADDYTSLSHASFRRLVARLADYYQFISDEEFIAQRGVCAAGRAQLHVTFDDAYKEIVDELLWAHEAYGFKATVYVIPDFIGKLNDWNTKCPYRIRHADTDEIHRLLASGFRVGDHTIGHQNLLKFGSDELHRRFSRARELFATEGIEPVSVAYPFGQYGSIVPRVASEFYKLGFSTETKSTSTDFDQEPLHLRRIVVSRRCSEESLLQRLRAY